ncbi:hypothetical protein L21SP2_3255 [Salinispira pacifica]|uniref:Uncharacterized protein n=1 Tax=Salinispira pacifica TaxID=1307761 RepID=V5WLW3_9SPIO|nr:hypothetical protein L21SP2_3255 [Salinispira pacifica]
MPEKPEQGPDSMSPNPPSDGCVGLEFLQSFPAHGISLS